MNSFDRIQGKLGFGFMRLPMQDKEIDIEETKRMVDAFMAAGFNYFDTAHGYLGGKSEGAIREAVTSRYPRESYVLATKLSPSHFNSQEEIRPLFESQLEACGVDYFDFYLMHTQHAKNFPKYKECRAYETALELKAEGKICHMGISFHDKAAVLDQILTEYPQVEFVQIQFNYLDFESPSVEARKCYEVCRKHGKPIIVMEPVKGGNLADLPEEANAVLSALGDGSSASYAIRFAASFEGVIMVLSGMGSMAMMEDNIGFMQDFQPLTEAERAGLDQVCAILESQSRISCTECEYCTEVCPKGIGIPDIFSCLNRKQQFANWPAREQYHAFYAPEGKKASDCIQCGECENACPQHLPTRELLTLAVEEFER